MKNVYKMKKIKALALAAMIPFASVAVPATFFTGCGGDDGKTEQEMADFTFDIAGTSYSVTVKHPASFDATDINGIKNKLTDALNGLGIPSMGGSDKARFDAVLGRGLVIVVEEGPPYNSYKVVNYCTMSFHADYLSTATVANIGNGIYDAIYDHMHSMVAARLSNEWLIAAMQRQKEYQRRS